MRRNTLRNRLIVLLLSAAGCQPQQGADDTESAEAAVRASARTTATTLPGQVEAEDFDNGGEGSAYHDSDTTNWGGAYRSTCVDIEATSDTGGGYDVGWTAAGEWLNYTVNVAAAATYTLQVRVAGFGGSFHVEFGGVNKTGTINVPTTGGWQTWTTVSATVTLGAGKQVMRLYEESAGLNYNWIKLDSSSSPPPPPPSGTCGGGSAQSGDVTVNLSDARQGIAGFGASTAWGSSMSSTDADLLWSTTTGAGLSLHRVRIDPTTGQTSELNIAKLAVARGVKVWATPWTPPAADKSNNSLVMGTLSDPQRFATFLAGFVSYMKGQGVDIYAISAQNEPDANVDYESCSYTPSSLASFIGGYMGPTLAPTGVKIMGPETQNWCGFPSYESAILSDANATRYTSIIATHEYGCSPAAYPAIAQAGKEFWQTEIYDTNGTADAGMGSGLRVARLIHDAMTVASMNAWHYWWVYPITNDNGALWDKSTGQASKRLWVEGNFARFVRPGFQRVGTGGTTPAGVLVSAYKNPADNTVAIVAINNNTSSTSLSVFISGAAPCNVTPWVTSSSDSLASKGGVSVSGSRFSFALEPQSVTTFVGKP